MKKRKGITIAVAVAMTLGLSMNSFAFQYSVKSNSELASSQKDSTKNITVNDYDYSDDIEGPRQVEAWNLKKTDAVSFNEWNCPEGENIYRMWLEVFTPNSDGTYDVVEWDYGIVGGNVGSTGSRIPLVAVPYNGSRSDRSTYLDGMDLYMGTATSNADVIKVPISAGMKFDLYDIVSKNQDRLGGYKPEDCLYMLEFYYEDATGNGIISYNSNSFIRFVD